MDNDQTSQQSSQSPETSGLSEPQIHPRVGGDGTGSAQVDPSAALTSTHTENLNWMEWIEDENIRNSGTIKSLSTHKEPRKAINEFAKKLVNLEGLLGKKGTVDYSKTDEEIIEFRQTLNPPKLDELIAPEIKSEDGSVYQLPVDVDDLIKSVVDDRKLSKSDYENIYKNIADVMRRAPEICDKELIAKYSESGLKTIRNSCERVCGMMGESGQVLLDASRTNPDVAVGLATLARAFGESGIPQETLTRTGHESIQSLQKQVQDSLSVYTKLNITKGRNDPETRKAAEEHFRLNQQLYQASQNQG